MRVFLALVRDAWRESLDRRSVQIILLIGLLIAFLCVSLSFTLPEPDTALELTASNLGRFGRHSGIGGPSVFSFHDVRVEVDGVRAARPEDDLPSGIGEPRVIELRFRSTDELDELARRWRSFQEKPFELDEVEKPSGGERLSMRERADFLVERFESAGFNDVIAKTIGGDDRAWLVAAGSARPAELTGAWKLGVLFNAFEVEIDEFGPAVFILGLELVVAGQVVGFIGMLVLLSMFASTVPEMVRKGSIDLVLARPIGRIRYLLTRYAAALLTVLGVTAAIFGACSLALLARSGLVHPSFVLCSLTATAIFAMLFPVAMLVGILTRSSGAATIVSLACWGLSSGVVQARDGLKMFGKDGTVWARALDVVYWFVPKTGDVDKLNAWFLSRSQLSPEAIARFGDTRSVDWWFAGGTSALFAVVVLSLAAWVFHRRDW